MSVRKHLIRSSVDPIHERLGQDEDDEKFDRFAEDAEVSPPNDLSIHPKNDTKVAETPSACCLCLGGPRMSWVARLCPVTRCGCCSTRSSTSGAAGARTAAWPPPS